MADTRYLSLYIPVQQAIVSYWLGELPLPQTSVLLYISERTLRWGKSAERINRTHFLQGVTSNDGRLIHNGVSLTSTTLWNAIHALEEKELVEIQHHPRQPRGNQYAVHIQNVLAPVTDGVLQTFAKNKGSGGRRRRFNQSSIPGEGID